jgi:hypothetical protein
MPILLTWILEVVVYALLELLVLVVGHGIARLLLPLLSVRKLQVQPLDGPSAHFNLLGYRRVGNGQVEVQATATGSIGLVIGLAACVAIVLVVRTALGLR